MAGMGPPPKDPSRRARRNATIAMTQLPAQGRTGAAPKWPLLPDVRALARLKVAEEMSGKLRDDWAAAEDGRQARALAKRLEQAEVAIAELRQQIENQDAVEKLLWREVWTTPQAVMWERLRWTREVAQYVRWKVLAEFGDMDASKEARQLADRLGLNPLAMLRLRWAVAADEVAEKRQAKTARAKAATGARARRGPLRAVETPKKAAGDD